MNKASLDAVQARVAVGIVESELELCSRRESKSLERLPDAIGTSFALCSENTFQGFARVCLCGTVCACLCVCVRTQRKKRSQSWNKVSRARIGSYRRRQRAKRTIERERESRKCSGNAF